MHVHKLDRMGVTSLGGIQARKRRRRWREIHKGAEKGVLARGLDLEYGWGRAKEARQTRCACN